LPVTADELCDVAHDLGVDPATHLYLGAMATETKVKQLSNDGSLAKYKIVHFATHGAVAGEVSRTLNQDCSRQRSTRRPKLTTAI
jgi:CHAT domain-containing protein